MNLLLNFHLYPSSKSFNFHVPSILSCCFYETLEILPHPHLPHPPLERQLCIMGTEALGLTQLKILFLGNGNA